jgi:hypothetical protein
MPILRLIGGGFQVLEMCSSTIILGVNLITVWGIIEGPLKELKKITELIDGMP